MPVGHAQGSRAGRRDRDPPRRTGSGAERIVVRLVTVRRVYHVVVALAKDVAVARAARWFTEG